MHHPICAHLSVDCRPIYRSTIGRLLVDCRSTIGRQSTDYRSTIDRLSVDCRPIIDRYIGQLSADASADMCTFIGPLSADISADVSADMSTEATYSTHDPFSHFIPGTSATLTVCVTIFICCFAWTTTLTTLSSASSSPWTGNFD